jgi:hypothetical protein
MFLRSFWILQKICMTLLHKEHFTVHGSQLITKTIFLQCPSSSHSNSYDGSRSHREFSHGNVKYVQPVKVVPDGPPVPAILIAKGHGVDRDSHVSNSYGVPKPSYNAPSSGYGAPKPSYNAPTKPTYDG